MNGPKWVVAAPGDMTRSQIDAGHGLCRNRVIVRDGRLMEDGITFIRWDETTGDVIAVVWREDDEGTSEEHYLITPTGEATRQSEET